ncbi:MAG: Asp/Glu/hydantoin racemase [Ectothiorhodospiraceae bacterium]|nr:Asp/Glu/hydantoin racemase [Chromatiales bacterium]MCP5153606.1 Asp/Glu/hydantoin racemase [Ectothiorhodospiraceae bacterium]
MRRTRLGILTPSSNTVLEPLSSAMVASLPDVTAHFGRFAVTEIALSPASRAQFELDHQLAAARLLADARVGSIVWSGTSASWLGFDRDHALCRAITSATGIPAGSSVLAINELLALVGARRFALVSPYTGDVQSRIVDTYARHGLQCVAERHLGEHRNYAFATFEEPQIADLVRQCAAAGPDAITIMCTNMRGARIAPELERELGVPVLDSTAAAVWTAMRLAGDDPRRIEGWGQMFALG